MGRRGFFAMLAGAVAAAFCQVAPPAMLLIDKDRGIVRFPHYRVGARVRAARVLAAKWIGRSYRVEY